MYYGTSSNAGIEILAEKKVLGWQISVKLWCLHGCSSQLLFGLKYDD